jgi:hypothetical protein
MIYRMNLLLTIFSLLSICYINLPSSALSYRSDTLARFEDYTVASISKEYGEVIGISRTTDSESMAQFQRRIRQAAKKGANFAGRYAIVGWSCGMICVNLAIVDNRTGKIHGTPFIGIGDGPCPDSYNAEKPKLIEFRTDSRLLILRGAAEDPGKDGTFHDAPCSTRYYVWKKNRLVLIKEVLYK